MLEQICTAMFDFRTRRLPIIRCVHSVSLVFYYLKKTHSLIHSWPKTNQPYQNQAKFALEEVSLLFSCKFSLCFHLTKMTTMLCYFWVFILFFSHLFSTSHDIPIVCIPNQQFNSTLATLFYFSYCRVHSDANSRLCIFRRNKNLYIFKTQYINKTNLCLFEIRDSYTYKCTMKIFI